MLYLEFERRKRGWTQTYLAHLVGDLSPRDISFFERGRFLPNATQTARLAAALGIPPHSLLLSVVEPGVLEEVAL